MNPLAGAETGDNPSYVGVVGKINFQRSVPGCSKFQNLEPEFNKLKDGTEYAQNPKCIKKAALQAAWYDCFGCGDRI